MDPIEFLDLRSQKIVSLLDCLLTPAFKHVVNIDLSRNVLQTTEGIATCPQLETLVLYFNAIDDAAEFDRLQGLSKLKVLDTRLNPASSRSEHREHILSIFPNLQRLDGQLLTNRRTVLPRHNIRQILPVQARPGRIATITCPVRTRGGTETSVELRVLIADNSDQGDDDIKAVWRQRLHKSNQLGHGMGSGDGLPMEVSAMSATGASLRLDDSSDEEESPFKSVLDGAVATPASTPWLVRSRGTARPIHSTARQAQLLPPQVPPGELSAQLRASEDALRESLSLRSSAPASRSPSPVPHRPAHALAATPALPRHGTGNSNVPAAASVNAMLDASLSSPLIMRDLIKGIPQDALGAEAQRSRWYAAAPPVRHVAATGNDLFSSVLATPGTGSVTATVTGQAQAHSRTRTAKEILAELTSASKTNAHPAEPTPIPLVGAAAVSQIVVVSQSTALRERLNGIAPNAAANVSVQPSIASATSVASTAYHRAYADHSVSLDALRRATAARVSLAQRLQPARPDENGDEPSPSAAAIRQDGDRSDIVQPGQAMSTASLDAVPKTQDPLSKAAEPSATSSKLAALADSIDKTLAHKEPPPPESPPVSVATAVAPRTGPLDKPGAQPLLAHSVIEPGWRETSVPSRHSYTSAAAALRSRTVTRGPRAGAVGVHLSATRRRVRSNSETVSEKLSEPYHLSRHDLPSIPTPVPVSITAENASARHTGNNSNSRRDSGSSVDRRALSKQSVVSDDQYSGQLDDRLESAIPAVEASKSIKPAELSLVPSPRKDAPVSSGSGGGVGSVPLPTVSVPRTGPSALSSAVPVPVPVPVPRHPGPGYATPTDVWAAFAAAQMDTLHMLREAHGRLAAAHEDVRGEVVRLRAEVGDATARAEAHARDAATWKAAAAKAEAALAVATANHAEETLRWRTAFQQLQAQYRQLSMAEADAATQASTSQQS